MDISTVIAFAKELIATAVILLTMMSPAFDKTGAPYKAENPDELVMSMSVVSDIHVETNNSATYENFKNLLKGLKGGEDIDAVAYLGDNVMNGQITENLFFYNAVKAMKPAKEQFVIAGNHDFGNGDGNYDSSYNDFIANNRLYLGNKSKTTYYYRIVNGCYVIVLASEDKGAEEFHMSDAQIEWMKGVLEEAKAADAPIIVLNHFPIYYIKGENSEGVTRDYREIAWILNQYDKLLYLHGHIHNDLGADNFYNWWGVDCINLPRSTESKEYEPGDGVVIEVYDDHFLVRGRDFIKGEWVDGLEYTYNF